MVISHCCIYFSHGNIIFQIWEPLKKSFGRVIAADMLGLGFSDKPVSNILSDCLHVCINEIFNIIVGIQDNFCKQRKLFLMEAMWLSGQHIGLTIQRSWEPSRPGGGGAYSLMWAI